MPDERELPPKSHAVLSNLDGQKSQLSRQLSLCVNNNGCHNPDRAKDYLRTYACSIFDLLWEYYDLKIDVFDFQKEIGEEAIRNVLSCWDNFNSVSRGTTWIPTLKGALIQHAGRPIWGHKPKPSLQHDVRVRVPRSIESMSAAVKMERHREKIGLNQTQFASKLRLDPKTLYKFRRTGKVDKRIAADIAAEMGITVEEFIK